MDLTFVPMNRDYAEEFLSWRYDPPYDLYNIGAEDRAAELAHLCGQRDWIYAILRDEELIGIRSFASDAQVDGGGYDDSYLDTGGALRPDLTGKGLGEEVVRKGIELGRERYGTNRFRVTIAAFNARAIKVCTRIGFRERERFRRPGDGREFVVFTIELKR